VQDPVAHGTGRDRTCDLGRAYATVCWSTGLRIPCLASSTCSETVGTLPVYLTVSHSFGGFGGIKVTSTTHPSGLGPGDELVVGAGPTGNPVDFIVFHKSTVYVDLSANGANPSRLTTLARQVYRLLP
jgi:hypothetical protein